MTLIVPGVRIQRSRRSARPGLVIPLLITLLASSISAAAQERRVLDAERDSSNSVRQESRELVVLVHGMGRSSLSMLPLARTLEKEGYEVLNWGYSSLCCTVAELSELLQRDVQQGRGATSRRVHFVGHSLGNIIIRGMLTREDAPQGVGHVVMLAPPNQGSHEADRHSRSMGWLLRPIADLRTDSTSTVRRLPMIQNVSTGIIAGRFDGKVSVEETHLPEESAHVVVAGAHSFLMLRSDVHRLVIGFLREGWFPTVEGVVSAPH